MTRQEHLDWCKQRALKYLDAGDLNNAFASMISDIRKHPETAVHGGIELGVMLKISGLMSSPEEIRKFIEGFR